MCARVITDGLVRSQACVNVSVLARVSTQLQRETTFAVMRKEEERRQNELIMEARKQAAQAAGHV